MSKTKKFANEWYRRLLSESNKYASKCGAGDEGAKGFQPGNTCGGDGDGSNTSGDQGGGDHKSNLDERKKIIGGAMENLDPSMTVWDAVSELALADHEDDSIRTAAEAMMDELNYQGVVGQTNPDGSVLQIDQDSILGESGGEIQEFLKDQIADYYFEDDRTANEILADTGSGEGTTVGTDNFLSTGSGSIELELSDEALRDGPTIYNSGIKDVSDDVLNSEIEELGGEWDLESMSREDREELMLDSMVMEKEDRAFEEGGHAPWLQGEAGVKEVQRDLIEEASDSGDGDVSWTSETVQDEVDNLEGVSIESKSDLQDHLDALYHYEGEEGEQLDQGYVDEVWDKLQADTGAGDGGVDSIQNNLIGKFSDKVSPGLSDVFASKFDVALERGDRDTANFDDIVQEAVNLTQDLPHGLEESDYRDIIGEALMGDDFDRPLEDVMRDLKPDTGAGEGGDLSFPTPLLPSGESGDWQSVELDVSGLSKKNREDLSEALSSIESVPQFDYDLENGKLSIELNENVNQPDLDKLQNFIESTKGVEYADTGAGEGIIKIRANDRRKVQKFLNKNKIDGNWGAGKGSTYVLELDKEDTAEVRADLSRMGIWIGESVEEATGGK